MSQLEGDALCSEVLSGVPARWADKLKALELLMKHLGLTAPEQHQHLHQHVPFTPGQLRRMTDDQLQEASPTDTMPDADEICIPPADNHTVK